MKTLDVKIAFGSTFTQIAWVVKDVHATKQFFEDVMGIKNFSDVMTIRAKDYNATYYGKPTDGESLVALAYSDGTFIELIQPVSGNSIFQDYLDKNPAGGIQHVAVSIPVAELDKVIAEMETKGFPVVSYFDTPIAKIAFFDTTRDTGVFTEVMGITEAGEEAVRKMKGGTY